MANSQVSHSEAKSICDALECSPSQHDDTGHFGGPPSLSPKHGEAVTGGTHLPTHTSGFHEKVSSGRDSKAGYKGKFAKKASQA